MFNITTGTIHQLKYIHSFLYFFCTVYISSSTLFNGYITARRKKKEKETHAISYPLFWSLCVRTDTEITYKPAEVLAGLYLH